MVLNLLYFAFFVFALFIFCLFVCIFYPSFRPTIQVPYDEASLETRCPGEQPYPQPRPQHPQVSAWLRWATGESRAHPESNLRTCRDRLRDRTRDAARPLFSMNIPVIFVFNIFVIFWRIQQDLTIKHWILCLYFLKTAIKILAEFLTFIIISLFFKSRKPSF